MEEGYYRAVTDGKLSDLLPQAEFGADGKTLFAECECEESVERGCGRLDNIVNQQYALRDIRLSHFEFQQP